jgi:hypothetical protein
MTTPDAPDISDPPDPGDAQDTSSGAGAGADPWDTPSFVHELSSGVKPSPDPVTLDVETAREVNRKLREIEEARAAAAVSGRDYLIN